MFFYLIIRLFRKMPKLGVIFKTIKKVLGICFLSIILFIFIWVVFETHTETNVKFHIGPIIIEWFQRRIIFFVVTVLIGIPILIVRLVNWIFGIDFVFLEFDGKQMDVSVWINEMVILSGGKQPELPGPSVPTIDEKQDLAGPSGSGSNKPNQDISKQIAKILQIQDPQERYDAEFNFLKEYSKTERSLAEVHPDVWTLSYNLLAAIDAKENAAEAEAKEKAEAEAMAKDPKGKKRARTPSPSPSSVLREMIASWQDDAIIETSPSENLSEASSINSEDFMNVLKAMHESEEPSQAAAGSSAAVVGDPALDFPVAGGEDEAPKDFPMAGDEGGEDENASDLPAQGGQGPGDVITIFGGVTVYFPSKDTDVEKDEDTDVEKDEDALDSPAPGGQGSGGSFL